ncbi:MAG: NUDIX hydrolase [Chitinophagales bacterium]
MIKINIQAHTLFIASDVCAFNLDSINKNRAITYRYTNTAKLREILALIPDFDIKNHIIYHSDPQYVFQRIFKIYKKIEAAGGLVINERNQILFIFRNGKWDLPKGKMEMNETKELTAIREVEEECGIKVGKLKKHIVTTYHTYFQNGKDILKANYWYLMDASSLQTLTPQVSEGIDSVQWKGIDEIEKCLENSYDSIKDVINQYLRGSDH